MAKKILIFRVIVVILILIIFFYFTSRRSGKTETGYNINNHEAVYNICSSL